MEDKVLVSVVMITYGHEKFIREAIEGVLMQKGDFDLELIIANDASPDATDNVVLEILKNHPKNESLRYIKHEANIGMMPNFIFALQQAKGKYIALCDGDDYWTNSYKLLKQIDFLEANPDYVLSFHKVKILRSNGTLVDDFITEIPEKYETQETLARLGNYIHTPSVVYRNIIKVFPYEFSLSPIGDYFLYMLLTEHGKIKYLEDEMAVYRYGVGIHSTHTQIKMAKANFKLFTLLLSYFNEPKINRILLARQLDAFDNLENLIRSEYTEAFVSHNVFLKAIHSLQKPSKFWRKLKHKITR